MTINTVEGNRRRSSNVTSVNALFIDYDKGDWSTDDLDLFLAKFGVKPHLVVETSPGNYHVYWRVKGVPLQQFKPIQQRLARMFNADEKVCDLPRVMRMPGTTNHNHDVAFVANTVYVADDPTHIPLPNFTRQMFGSSNVLNANVDSVVSIRSGSAKHESHDKGTEAERVWAALMTIRADDRETWITIGMALKNGLDDRTGLKLFKKWSMRSTKYDEQELERQWGSIKRDGGITLGTLFWQAKVNSPAGQTNVTNKAKPATLLELTKDFAESTVGKLMHSESDKAWWVCSNGFWEKSHKAALRRSVQYLSDAMANVEKSKNRKHRELLESQQSTSSARELLRAAESQQILSCTASTFDLAPNLIGVKLAFVPGALPQYGVIDLNENQFRYAMPSDKLSHLVGSTYDPSAKCPLWMAFLDQITVGDSDLVKFLQLAVGYTLFGHTNEQVMFVLIGSGGNGKGVFTRTIYAALGEFSAVLQSNLLKPGAISATNPSPALMKLKSKRFWACSEVPKGMVLDEALTKQLTGGDLISTRGLYADQDEFLPVGKLWLSVNDMPRVRHDDKGMWRRIVAIPFNAVFSTKNQDTSLEGKLKAELPGILNWCLEGAHLFATKGRLGRPKASRELLASLRGDVDTVGIWMASCCVDDERGKLQSKAAYDNYVEAMKREKITALSQKEFKADLVRRGYAHKSGSHFNYHVGLTIKSD